MGVVMDINGAWAWPMRKFLQAETFEVDVGPFRLCMMLIVLLLTSFVESLYNNQTDL
jgi:hypothetical protein